MMYNENNFDNSECLLFFPGDTLEDCYKLWNQETWELGTPGPVTSSLHSSNKKALIAEFKEYWM